jgi:hypothetical protein
VLRGLVVLVLVGGLGTLLFCTLLALTSARSFARALQGARAELQPAVEELTATGREIASRVQRLRR